MQKGCDHYSASPNNASKCFYANHIISDYLQDPPQWPFTGARETGKKRGEIGKVGKVSIQNTAKLRRNKRELGDC